MKLKTKIAFATLLLSPSTFAVNSINVQTFNPSTSDHFVFLEDGFRSEWPKKAKFYLGANYNYMNDPLTVLDSTQTTRVYTLINSVQTFDFFFGFKASNNLGLFIAAPVHFISYSASAPAGFPRTTQSGFGDLKIMGKIRVTDDDSPTSLAIIPEFHLPTGNTENFVSDASTYVALRLALERQFQAFTLAANVGFATAANSTYDGVIINGQVASGIDYRKRLLLGVGGFLPFSDAWGMNLEFTNISMIPLDSTQNPNDAYLGIRYASNDSLVFTAGGAVGRIGGSGGSDYRIVAGVRYTILDDQVKAPVPIATPAPTPIAVSTPAPTPAPRIIDQNKNAVMHEREIVILSPINFEHNSYKLAPDSKQILDDVASLMLKHKDAYRKVMVDGHTSHVGSDKYNLKLSIARARSVKSYLVSKKLSANVLEARGFGFRRPKVRENSKGAESTNRRVEFIIVK